MRRRAHWTALLFWLHNSHSAAAQLSKESFFQWLLLWIIVKNSTPNKLSFFFVVWSLALTLDPENAPALYHEHLSHILKNFQWTYASALGRT